MHEPTTITCDAGSSESAKGEQWQSPAALLVEMVRMMHEPNTVTCNAGCSAGDGLVSRRTHSATLNAAGYENDGLASMRTHSLQAKSLGHAGTGLASMRTHSATVNAAGYEGEVCGIRESLRRGVRTPRGRRLRATRATGWRRSGRTLCKRATGCRRRWCALRTCSLLASWA